MTDYRDLPLIATLGPSGHLARVARWLSGDGRFQSSELPELREALDCSIQVLQDMRSAISEESIAALTQEV